MTELKTVEDIEEYRACPDYESSYNLDDKKEYTNYYGQKEIVVDVDILKQSAIDDIKELNNTSIKGNLRGSEHVVVWERSEIAVRNNLAKIEYIKWKFNITDAEIGTSEDLK